MNKYQEVICDYLDRVQMISAILLSEEYPKTICMSTIEKFQLARDLAVKMMDDGVEIDDLESDVYNWLESELRVDLGYASNQI